MPLNTPLLVILIEDHDELREATQEWLEQAGFETRAVTCAEDFDDLTLHRPPELFVVDLNLPGEDGLALAARLRRTYPEAGIVITTARSRLDDRVRGYEQGADVYLPKPVDPPELLAVLRALGQRRRSAPRSTDCLLQLDGRQLLLKGPRSQCRLSEAEVRLLMALAAAREQTLERWQVAAQLSPGHENVSADNLQNRLSTLRRKLHTCGVEGESIKSIRNMGYRLCVPLSVS